jgi:hypothetical protein
MRLNDGRGLMSHRYNTDEIVSVEDFKNMSIVEQRNLTNFLALYVMNTFSTEELITNDLFNVCLGGVTIQQTDWDNSLGMTINILPGVILSFNGYLNSADWSLVPGDGEVTAVCVPDDMELVCSPMALNYRGNVEIRCIRDTLEESNRKFRNPSTLAVTESDIDTRAHFTIQAQFVAGTSITAPAVTAGWIKIAEVETNSGDQAVMSLYEIDQWTSGADTVKHINSVERNALTEHLPMFKAGVQGAESTQFVHATYDRVQGKALWSAEKDSYYLASELDGTSSYWSFGYSQNGKDWTFNDISGDLATVYDLAYSPVLDRFVVAGLNASGGIVFFYSDVGSVTTFTFVATAYTSNAHIKNIIWSEKLQQFVAVGGETTIGTSFCFISSDGISWSVNNISAIQRYVSQITYSEAFGYFCVLVGHTSNVYSYTSEDCVTWTVGTKINATTATAHDIDDPNGIILMYNESLNLWVAVLKSNVTVDYLESSYSRDGVNWSGGVYVCPFGAIGDYYESGALHIHGSESLDSIGVFMIAGWEGISYYTKDGVSWYSLRSSIMKSRSLDGRIGYVAGAGQDNRIYSLVWNSLRAELLVVKKQSFFNGGTPSPQVIVEVC